MNTNNSHYLISNNRQAIQNKIDKNERNDEYGNYKRIQRRKHKNNH